MIKLTMHFEKELEPTAYHTLVQASSWLIISGNFIGVIVTALLFFQSL
ncbi:hypothetical protein [uncultured Croceitalea sp.]